MTNTTDPVGAECARQERAEAAYLTDEIMEGGIVSSEWIREFAARAAKCRKLIAAQSQQLAEAIEALKPFAVMAKRANEGPAHLAVSPHVHNAAKLYERLTESTAIAEFAAGEGA